VDGHPTHKAKLVKQFLATTDGTLEIFVLPAYSPQLHPDEWVWKNVEHDRIGHASVTNADDLKAEAVGALRHLQNMPPTSSAHSSPTPQTSATSPHDQSQLNELLS
jgi:hypothetical protein